MQCCFVVKNLPRYLEKFSSGFWNDLEMELINKVHESYALQKFEKKIHETVVSMGIYLRTLPNSKVHLSS